MTRLPLTPAAAAIGVAVVSLSLSKGDPLIARERANVPDPATAQGAVRTTDVAEICGHGAAAERHWSRERDNRIMAGYGLPAGPHPDYEIDHLIPLGIGGADDDA